jgi:hypothetical protein
MANPIEIYTLHRYYVWANRMRTHLDEVLQNSQKDEEHKIEL